MSPRECVGMIYQDIRSQPQPVLICFVLTSTVNFTTTQQFYTSQLGEKRLFVTRLRVFTRVFALMNSFHLADNTTTTTAPNTLLTKSSQMSDLTVHLKCSDQTNDTHHSTSDRRQTRSPLKCVNV